MPNNFILPEVQLSKKRRSQLTRDQARRQQIAIVVTAIIAVIMIISLVASMLPAPPSPGLIPLLLVPLWF